MKFCFPTVLILFLLSSCAIELEAEKDSVRAENKMEYQTKSPDSYQIDSVYRVYIRQTDPDLRMIDMIYVKDGKYNLAIDNKGAIELGIPPTTYNKYYEYVNNLNDKR